MSEKNQGEAASTSIDVTLPAYSEVLKTIVNETQSFGAVALIDTQREQCQVRPAPDASSADPVQLGKDMLGEGAGSARRELLGLDSVTFAGLQVGRYWLLLLPTGSDRVVVACIDCQNKLETLQRHARKILQKLQNQEMVEALQNHESVKRGWLLDLAQDAAIAEFKRIGSEQQLALKIVDELHPVDQILPAARAFLDANAGQPRLDWLQGVMLEIAGHIQIWQRLKFVPECLLWVMSDGAGWNGEATAGLVRLQNDVLRQRIAEILSSGLETMIEPFPQTDMEFNGIVEELRNLEDFDLVQRLVVGGFADHPIGEGEDRMRCMECIYFLPHGRWCDLPELPVPVEADWFCRLWKM